MKVVVGKWYSIHSSHGQSFLKFENAPFYINHNAAHNIINVKYLDHSASKERT